MSGPAYDIAIVGGGVNGAGIARDAAGRGLSVFLCERGDLAQATSSASTKLIHGGLRYLEYGEFRLVREALREREVLWRIAPHIVRPLRFVLPHRQGLRPAPLLRLGLFLYDHLGGRKLLPGTRSLDLRRDETGKPLKPLRRGFEYSDCWVDDSRLVVLNALDAAERGAEIRTRCECLGAQRDGERWRVTVKARDGRQENLTAKVLVNAAGPWVHSLLTERLGLPSPARVRQVRGSHIVVPKLYAHDRCYIFQNDDKRIVFAIPYQDDFTLIGTTDRDHAGDPAEAQATAEEIAYLCRAVSLYFARPVEPAAVVWSYAGVRPLYDDGAGAAQAATRDYVLALDPAPGAALLSIFGGKITTYRKLAEHALDKLAPQLGPRAALAGSWTGGRPLPGGDFAIDGLAPLIAALRGKHPFLAAAQAERLARLYGTRAFALLDGSRGPADLGRHFGATLTEAEVRYLMRREWALSAQDLLWRRTKLGLRFTAAETAALDAWMAEQASGAPAASQQ